jgi:hypothetical protein
MLVALHVGETVSVRVYGSDYLFDAHGHLPGTIRLDPPPNPSGIAMKVTRSSAAILVVTDEHRRHEQPRERL